MQELLRNHNSDDFKFLDPSQRSSDTVVSRSRTVYYTMLSRILFADDNVDADFWRFIKPWEVILNQAMLAFEGKGGLGEAQIRVGRLRDGTLVCSSRSLIQADSVLFALR